MHDRNYAQLEQTCVGGNALRNAPKSLEVPDALESMGRVIEVNRALIEQLSDRVSGIRARNPQSEGNGTMKMPPMYSCHIASVVHSHNIVLSETNQLINALLQELQV